MTNEEIRNKVLNDLNEVFGDLVFEESTHSYNAKGFKFESVTQSLSKLSDKFDTDFMAPLVAKKYNRENPNKPKRNAFFYKMLWKEKAKEASTRGTRVHLYSEEYPFKDTPDPICKQEQAVKDFYDSLDENYVVITAEYRVYSIAFLKAGTIDLLLYNKETNNLVIADWKTNNANVVECYSNKKLKAPFTDLINIKYNKFALQLSNYKMMIEKYTDYKVEGLWIMWLQSGNPMDLAPDRNPKKYSIHKPDNYIKHSNYIHFLLPDYSDRILEMYENYNKFTNPLNLNSNEQ